MPATEHWSRVSSATAPTAINLVGILRQRGNQDFFALHRGWRQSDRRGSVTGQSGAPRPYLGNWADPNADSLYAKSKGEGERAVFEAFPAATILRPSVIFGAEDQFFNRFASMAKFSPFLPIVGGDTKFQPVYVDDVAAAAVAALIQPAAVGWVYELGGPQTYRFGELLKLMLKEIGIRRQIVDLPLPIASLIAHLTSMLPNPPITADQIRLLRKDSVVSPAARRPGRTRNCCNAVGNHPSQAARPVPALSRR